MSSTRPPKRGKTRLVYFQIFRRLALAPSFYLFLPGIFDLLVRILSRVLGPSRRKRFLINIFYAHPPEPEVVEFVRGKKGNLFIDCGANVGLYTLIAAKNFREVYAVEPERNNAKTLSEAIEADNLSNVRIIECAVADFNGTTSLGRVIYPGASPDPPMWTIERAYDYSSLQGFQRKNVHVLAEPVLQVPVRTLESIIGTVPMVDLVKVDVEGAEWRILKGAEPVMERIRSWIIELHDLTRKRELMSYMKNHGYKYKWLDGQHAYFVRL